MALAGELVRASDIATGAQQADVAASQGTTSTSYADLATAGPAVTVSLVAGQIALVIVYARLVISVAGLGHQAYMSYAVSGASGSIAASDTDAIESQTATQLPGCKVSVFTASGSGSHTFTAKYKSANVADTASFVNRRIVVVPLNPT